MLCAQIGEYAYIYTSLGRSALGKAYTSESVLTGLSHTIIAQAQLPHLSARLVLPVSPPKPSQSCLSCNSAVNLPSTIAMLSDPRRNQTVRYMPMKRNPAAYSRTHKGLGVTHTLSYHLCIMRSSGTSVALPGHHHEGQGSTQESEAAQESTLVHCSCHPLNT